MTDPSPKGEWTAYVRSSNRWVVQWLKLRAGNVGRVVTGGRGHSTERCVAGEDCTVLYCVCVCLPACLLPRLLATRQPACPGYWPKIVTPKRARGEMDGGKRGWVGRHHHRLVNIVCYPLKRRNASSDESNMKKYRTKTSPPPSSSVNDRTNCRRCEECVCVYRGSQLLHTQS